MAALPFVLLRMLADGRFHSGEAIARSAGMSRGSVWLAVRELERAGLEIYKVRGRGYRLPQPVSVLERAAIVRHLGCVAPQFSLELADSVDSTNTLLMRRAGAGAAHATVIVAEYQSDGRGRMGRAWHAGIGGGLMFSLLWRFEQGAGALAGLSLATGVALARAFERLGVAGAVLKWPNDVIWEDAKLAGILIEMQGDALGPSFAVIGVGINVRLTEAVRRRVERPVADLESACGRALDRNEVLALVLGALRGVVEDFSRAGFAPLREEWQRRHAHQDRMVTLALADGSVRHGIARGVAEDGALLVEAEHAVRRYHAGEVSLRLLEPVMGMSNANSRD
jgi:BirA family biotin operon repressor/biotin-[acetyl-CoA-carboxylase] ligase